MSDATLPLGQADRDLLELSTLRREIDPLRAIADRAAYVRGPAACVEGDCDHDDEPCPDVVEGHATIADVNAREGLEDIVVPLLLRLAHAALHTEPVSPAELVAELEDEIRAVAHRLYDLPGGEEILARSLYRNIIAAESARGGSR